MIEVQTRKSLVLTLDRAGITGPAADLLIRESAPARAESRVLATIATALAADLLHGEEDAEIIGEVIKQSEDAARWMRRSSPDGLSFDNAPTKFSSPADLLDAWGVLAIDLAGVGGHGGYEGAGTSRHPVFRHLGAGRKHASDGGAWMAAAQVALEAITSAMAVGGFVNPRLAAREALRLPDEAPDSPQPLMLAVAYDDKRDGKEGADWRGLGSFGDESWWQAECARQLVAASKTPNGLEDAAPWANLYNQITRRILDAQEKANAAAEAANQATAKILADMDKSDATQAAQ